MGRLAPGYAGFRWTGGRDRSIFVRCAPVEFHPISLAWWVSPACPVSLNMLVPPVTPASSVTGNAPVSPQSLPIPDALDLFPGTPGSSI